MVETRGARPALSLAAGDRLVVVAPHPDDEVIGAGLLMQQAAAAGCEVFVLLVTLGDAFGTVATLQTIRRTSARRIALGHTRFEESVRALEILGLDPRRVVCLGYPDRGLSALWSEHWELDRPYRSPFTLVERSPYPHAFTRNAPYAGEQLLRDLMAVLSKWSPTLVVYPHPRDAHGDHSACAAFVTCALEELARRDPVAFGSCRRLHYLIHRGGWPAPRGLDARRVLDPPATMAELGEEWVDVWAEGTQVHRKKSAVNAYRSQYRLVGRFLYSFVAKNELFALPHEPVVPVLEPGTIVLGAREPEWQEAMGWARPLIVDPTRDTLTRQVERSADVASVDLRSEPGRLYVRIGLVRRPVPEVEYRISLFARPRGQAAIVRLRPPFRATWLFDGAWRHRRDIVVRPVNNALEAVIPSSLFGDADALFVSVETRSRGISIDRTGVHYVRLERAPDAADPVTFAVASPGDIAACARIFTQAFKESILHVFGAVPDQRIIRQVFRLCYDAEPDALIVALVRGEVHGYIYAPTSMRQVWRTAILRGHLARWIAAWGRGRYKIGWAPLRILLLDKFHFVRSSLGHDRGAEARILSIAVAEEMKGKGVGTHLVQHALRRFRVKGIDRVRLEVRPWNEAAFNLYRKLGFRPTGTAKDTRGDWVVMHCDL